MRADETMQQADGIAELRRLRAQHADAQISTELVRLDEEIVVIRAAIVLPNAGSATGFGATAAGGPEAVERAEGRALSRAASLLGFGAADRPAAVAEPAPAPKRQPQPEPAPAVTFTPEITREPIREPIRDEPAPVTPPVRTPPSAPARPAATSPAPVEDELELADYSWTEFWKWAKTTPFPNKPAVEELIGQPIATLNPAQVRGLMRSKAGIS